MNDSIPTDITIDKSRLAEMPTVVFGGQILVIDTPEDTEKAINYLSTQKVVGFDTETKPSFKKGQINTVSLLQLSTDDLCYLIRVNKTGLTQPIVDFLSSEDTLKIGLSTKDDFKVLSRLAPFTPGGFIELQQFVKPYRIADSSLQKIYGIIYGQRISKGQRLSNWDSPALTHAQCVYAATDAWACLKIYRTLSDGKFDPDFPDKLHESAQNHLTCDQVIPTESK